MNTPKANAAEITHPLRHQLELVICVYPVLDEAACDRTTLKSLGHPSQTMSGAKRLVAAPMSPAFTESIQRCASSTRSGVVDSSGISRLSPGQAGGSALDRLAPH